MIPKIQRNPKEPIFYQKTSKKLKSPTNNNTTTQNQDIETTTRRLKINLRIVAASDSSCFTTSLAGNQYYSLLLQSCKDTVDSFDVSYVIKAKGPYTTRPDLTQIDSAIDPMKEVRVSKLRKDSIGYQWKYCPYFKIAIGRELKKF